jgi:acyl transferase domain-containing protein/NAD(P)-dependent dehydrogenase (short-subunit alcohol dehydrogenase family)
VVVCEELDHVVLDKLPAQVTRVIVPAEWTGDLGTATRIDAVRSHAEAEAALSRGARALALKGSEGGGRVGQESSFILFLGLRERCLADGVSLYIYGGAGVHTSAAYLALGAQGVIFDSQVSLLPEASTPRELKARLTGLSGTETRLVDGFRFLRWPTMPVIADDATWADILPYIGGFDLEQNVLPLGQDFALAVDFVKRYGHLRSLVLGVVEAAYGHLRQAQAQPSLRPDSDLAQGLGITYPIVQGPMARVSDTPEFLAAVAEAGALPTLALGLASEQATARLLNEAAAAVGDHPWAVGLLGFADPARFQEQARIIAEMDHPPAAVVIAGGRPAQARRFETAGITAFLHVPSVTLLDMYLGEGVRHFIFEGRESGGHVGPIASTVLWERQIHHLLTLEDSSSLSVLFAGGIYDAASAAFVSIMAASLAARGTRVGVQLGTAYLLTQEAVSTGAVTGLFQKLALGAQETILLESVKGQETRALPTPYAEVFEAERQRIQGLDLDPLSKRSALEELNLGRARVASKGVDRIDRKTEVTQTGAKQALGDQAAPEDDATATSTLVPLDEAEQLSRGLFMCGSVATLMDEASSMADLHVAVAGSTDLMAGLVSPVTTQSSGRRRSWTTAAHVPAQEPIAIVGLAAIFPEAADADEYWRNNLTGLDTVAEVPRSRWNPDIFYRPDSNDNDFVASNVGAFVAAAEFDPVEFGITPQSVSSIEPVQLLSLIVAKRALMDAGYADIRSANFEDASVIFGTQAMGELSTAYGSRPGIRSMFGTLPEQVANELPKPTEDSFAGILSNCLSGRIANRLNLGGRNFSVDAACASSLASLDLACQELWADRTNMVLCGGADLHNALFDYLMFTATYALSKQGRCATFDESGDGLALGEGIGAVVLKRLSDAERDGDRIYSLIRGVHGSSDGRVLALTAPHANGQVRALRRAYQIAGVLPGEVGLIEAHGTGTAVGDRTELAALTTVLLDGGALPGQAYTGSVKTQIGHTKCAAGVAGLIRAALSTYYAVIPPTLHLEKPVRNYVPGRSPMSFNACGHAQPWNAERRIVGVSGFGFGGTNYHAIVQNYVPEPASGPILKSWPAELFLFRGDDLAAAKRCMEQVQALYEANHYLRLIDIAYSVAHSSDAPVQVAIVAKSWADLLKKLDAALADTATPGVFPRVERPGQVAFLFSGQGSQRINMAVDLFVLFPGLRQSLSAHPDYHTLLFPPSAFTDEAKQAQQTAITDTRNAQPLLGFVDLAIAQLLGQFGVQPDLVAGHSYGELPALAFAGVIDPEDLPELSRQRAEAILGAVGDDPGQMLALGLDPAAVAALLEGEEEVWAVNLNSPKQTVVGGSTDGIARFSQKLADQGIRGKILNVACAFHTPLLAGADSTFAKALRRKRFGKARVPVWSNTTAEVYPPQVTPIKQRLADHLVRPVRFTDELQAMYEAGARVFIEAGPGGVLSGLARDNLGDEVVAIQTERATGFGMTTFLEALGRYVATGRTIDIEQLFADRPATLLDLATPDAHRQSRTAWMVDGQKAVPATKWRENGDRHLEAPVYTMDDLRDFAMTEGGVNLQAEAQSGSDHLVYTYLQNVRTMLDDQRDIMLGYLGYADTPVGAGRRAIDVGPLDAGPTPPSQALVVSPSDSEVEVVDVDEDDDDDDGTVLRELQDLTPEDVHDLIIDVVSEKTGYPTDMLGLDMDLEADLSIDSIKRLEIIGSLNQKVALPNFEEMEMDEAETANALEHLASIKTLRGMISWLQEMVVQAQEEGLDELLAGKSGGTTASAVASTADGVAPERPALVAGSDAVGPMEVVRLVPVRQLYPLGQERLDLTGKRFALAGEGGPATAAVTAAIEAEGATVTLIDLADVAKAEPATWDGLVLLNCLGSPVTYTIKDLFDLVKAADLTHLEWLVVFDDTIGCLLEAEDLVGLGSIEGFSGLVKTLQIEYPKLRSRIVEAQQPFTAENLSKIAIDELSDPVQFPAVAYSGEERVRLIPIVEALEEEPSEGEPVTAGLDASITTLLDKDSVVLVIGGAQGISPALITRVAEARPCHFVLAGRTPHDKALINQYADLETAADVQKHLIGVEGLKNPKEVQARVNAIVKARTIEAALALIAATGADVSYETVDARDVEACRSLIRGVKDRFGRIDAVFHAAGIVEDKLFKDKVWESFERVYTTKTTPMTVIAEELFPDLKLLVLFGSMAASIGNRGQCDYAAGNAIFDSVAFVLGQRQAPIKAVSMAWGPWQGAGMVSATLEGELRRRGLSLIALDQGSEFFFRELAEGHAGNVIAIAGQSREIKAFIDQTLALPDSEA